jgi:membrane fusion protein (multidrug efflux system)
MVKKLFITVLGLLAVIGVIAWIYISMIKTLIDAPRPAHVEVISSHKVDEMEWRPVYSAAGSVTAVQGAILAVEGGGLVKSIHFDSGDTVEAGALLLELDSQAEQAQLRSAEAALKLAEIHLQRIQKLRAENSVPQSDLDSAQANADESKAQVDNLRAILAKRIVKAPFSGQLGIRQVNLGQYVNSGAAVVSLQSIDPVYVNFSIPQQQLGWIRVGLDVEVRIQGSDEPLLGKLTALDSSVNPNTRNLQLQATLKNSEGKLKPGMFVNVRVLQEDSRKVIAVPATAVMYASYGNSVYVVKKGEDGHLIADQHFVRLGETRGDFVEIVEGVKPGDEVVSSGAFKLRNGMAIQVNDKLALSPELNPDPKDS